GFAEQDSDAWWNAVVSGCQALRESNPDEMASLVAIGICGQMHTHVYLDNAGKPIRSALTWMDQRAQGIVSELNGNEETAAHIMAETSNNATPTYTAPQVAWIQKNDPDTWRSTSHVLVAKDYIKYKLTGEMMTDFSEAAGTLLFDVQKRAWSEAMFSLFEIPRSAFPQVGRSALIMGSVTSEVANLTGIPEGTPVANGSSDNSAAALGAGMIDKGQVTLIIGTAGVISACSDSPLPDPRHRVLCWNYCLEDRWINIGVMQTAGESLNWFKNAFEAGNDEATSGDIFSAYNRETAGVPDGCDGLLFLPYLNGERTPYWDSDARGVFFGVNLKTTKAHFVKAIMEGVSFALRNNVETVESLGMSVDRVQAVGGGLKSPVWLSVLSQIIGRPITTVAVPDTGNVGNTIIAGLALGEFSTAQEATRKLVSVDRVVEADPNPVYERRYEHFLGLYEDLKDRFGKYA
ncbi:MAG: xylulokinase, partial [Spirochaetaceae bacterium]|nr:xylulokinase [Spirochaetaceae bacterium]